MVDEAEAKQVFAFLEGMNELGELETESEIMKYQEEYRDPVAAKKLQQAIAGVTTRPWTIMEVCGGQTHTIVKYGIDELLPPQIELVHGPGCPVCVTPLELIDKAIEIAARPEVIFCSFGDMLRVPGSRRDLFGGQGGGRRRADRLFAARLPQNRRAKPRTGRWSSSPSASRRRRRPTRWRSSRRSGAGIKNFAVLVSHVLVPPAMTADPVLTDQSRAGFPGAPATSAR